MHWEDEWFLIIWLSFWPTFILMATYDPVMPYLLPKNSQPCSWDIDDWAYNMGTHPPLWQARSCLHGMFQRWQIVSAAQSGIVTDDCPIAVQYTLVTCTLNNPFNWWTINVLPKPLPFAPNLHAPSSPKLNSLWMCTAHIDVDQEMYMYIGQGCKRWETGSQFFLSST